MRSTLSLGAITPIMMALFSAVLAVRLPVDEVFRRDQWSAKEKLESRELCVEDDTLLSLQMYPDDTIPFCSTFISIPAQTAVSTVTVKTTVLAIATTSVTADVTATVASSTVTVTITQAPAVPLRKRQALAITPASDLIAQCSTDRVIASSLASACSCLPITETTITIPITSTSTRTESAIDYERSTFSNIVTSGVTTQTITVIPTITPAPPVSSGIPLPSSNITAPGTGIVTSYPGIVTTLPGSVVTLSGSVITYPGSVVTLPRGGPPEETSSGLLQSSGFPTLSMNSTLPTGPTIPPFTSASGSPLLPTNGSSITPILPLTTISGTPIISINSSLPSIISNNTVPTGNPVLDSCPIDNGTIYIELGQTFQILCATNFIGSEDQGFYVDSFYKCVHDCAAVNIGFSQSSCYGASYIPNNGVGSDCFLRNSTSIQSPEFDPKVTSAILLNNTLSPEINYNTTGGPPAIPSTNITSSTNTTSVSFSSVVSTNATGTPSGFPTGSANLSAPAFPTASANISVPPFGGPDNDNRTGAGGSGSGASGGFSSGFPTPSSNSSCGPWATATVTEIIAATTIYMTADLPSSLV